MITSQFIEGLSVTYDGPIIDILVKFKIQDNLKFRTKIISNILLYPGEKGILIKTKSGNKILFPDLKQQAEKLSFKLGSSTNHDLLFFDMAIYKFDFDKYKELIF